MTFNQIMEETSDMISLFLADLNDNEDNSLRITVCGAVKESGKKAYSGKNYGKAVEKILKNSVGISPDYSVIYEVTFENYVGYSVRNESHTMWDNSEKFEGRFFRIYSKSRYLDYIANAAPFAAERFDYAHYGICLGNHIIDVVSCTEPVITKKQKG